MFRPASGNLAEAARELLADLDLQLEEVLVRDELTRTGLGLSLAAAALALRKFGVQAVAIRCTPNQIQSTPRPAIAETTEGFVYLPRDSPGGSLATDVETVGDWRCTGNVLILKEPPSGARYRSAIQHARRRTSAKRARAVALAALASLPVIGAIPIAVQAPTAILTAITSLFGLSICYQLLRISLGSSTRLGPFSFCGPGDDSCRRILEWRPLRKLSPATLADLGIVHFSCCSATLLMSGIVGVDISKGAFTLGTLAATPVVLSLVYVQAFVLRQWCKLCLLSSTAVLVSTGISFPWIPTLLGSPLESAFVWFATTASVATLWTSLRALEHFKRRALIFEAQFDRVRSNPVMLGPEYQQSSPLPVSSRADHVSGGGARSDIVCIAKVGCSHCPEALRALSELRALLPDLIVDYIVVGDVSAAVDPELRRQTQRIDDWHGVNSQDCRTEWADPRRWRTPRWAHRAGLSHFPSLVLNGRLLPPSVRPHHLLPSLASRQPWTLSSTFGPQDSA